MEAPTRRSPGCQSCRLAKKGCDLTRPKCGRCMRLNQACGGYPKSSQPLITWPGFELPATFVRAQEEPGLPTLSSLDDKITEAEQLAFSFFSDEWSFLFTSYADNELVKSLIDACSLMAYKHHADDPAKEGESAIDLYVQALGTARMALLDKTRSQEDVMLVAAMLLANMERLNRRSGESSTRWMVHEDGISYLLENRSINQVRTKLGRTIFRMARDMVINAAFCRDIGTPRYIVPYTQAISHDPQQSIYDQLAILEARATHLWASYRAKDLGRSLREDNSAFLRDLQLWEHSAALSNDFQKFYGPLFSCAEQRSSESREMMQQIWPRARLETCRVVASRIERATCQKRVQTGHSPLSHVVLPFQESMLETTSVLCSSAGSAIQLISGARFLDIPTTSAFLLTRPLYIIASALSDELSEQTQIVGHRSRSRRKVETLLRSQITVAMEILQHLQVTIGDFHAREILGLLRSGSRSICSQY